VEIHPSEERIKELCSRAVTAEESEFESVLADLRAALRDHAQLTRLMVIKAAKDLNRVPKNYSPSKAAD
jgi:hypothetical protein